MSWRPPDLSPSWYTCYKRGTHLLNEQTACEQGSPFITGDLMASRFSWGSFLYNNILCYCSRTPLLIRIWSHSVAVWPRNLRTLIRPHDVLATSWEQEIWWHWCCTKDSWATLPPGWLPLFSALTVELPTSQDPEAIVSTFVKRDKREEALMFLSGETPFASCRFLSVCNKQHFQWALAKPLRCALLPSTPWQLIYHLHLVWAPQGQVVHTQYADKQKANYILTR